MMDHICKFAMACLRLIVSFPVAIVVSDVRSNVERHSEITTYYPDLVVTYHPGKAVLVAESHVDGDKELEERV